jgi:hypothetical protein
MRSRWGLAALGGVVLIVLILGVWLLFLKPGPPVAPTAAIEIRAQEPITPDVTVEFDASPSELGLPEERIQEVRYLWEFGDGSSATGEKVSHQYREPGDYEVKLTIEIIDTANRFYRAQGQTKVSVAIPPLPEPTIGVRISPDPDEEIIHSHDPVTFDAELSFTEPPSPHLKLDVEYVWTFTDEEGTLVERKEGRRISHKFNPPEEYQATLQMTVRDQYGRERSYTLERTVPIENLPPEVEVAFLDGDKDGQVEAGEPVIFDAEGSYDPDEGKLSFEWDFDNDGFIDEEGEEPKAKWEFLKPGTYTVIVQVYDEYMKERGQPPVTKVLTITVLGATAMGLFGPQGVSLPAIPELGRVVASGGMGLIGDLQLWNVAAGMNVNPLISVLAGYGANTNTVVLDRTGEYPYVSRAFRDAKITTVITSATMLSGIVYYQAYPNIYVGGGLGYLTLKGEHQSNHPRVEIGGSQVVPFTTSRIVLTFGVAYKLGFAFISIQVYYAM